MTEEINAVIVTEVLGKPKEHVMMAISQLIEKLGNEEGIEIINKKIHEPQIAQSTNNLFVSFAEIELRLPNLARLLDVCFVYMPSSIEITKPSELRIKLNDINSTLNFLTTKLHQYDAIAKRLTIEHMVMQKKLKELGVVEIDIKKEMETKKKTKEIKKTKGKKDKKHKKPRKKSKK